MKLMSSLKLVSSMKLISSLLATALFLVNTMAVQAEGSVPCEFRSESHIPGSYLLRHVEDVSRDYYYIHLKEHPDMLEICGIVGGEHITYYRILGFTNEHFRIDVESFNGEAFVDVSGEGVSVVTDDTGNGHDALIESEGTGWVEVSASASFDSFTSGYRVQVVKD